MQVLISTLIFFISVPCSYVAKTSVVLVALLQIFVGRSGCPPFGGDPGGPTFSICCQTQTPQSAHMSGACGDAALNCTQVNACQSAGVASEAVSKRSVLQNDRSPIRLREMKTFFELLILPYLTQSDTDPVFLDAEHVLLSLLLVLAAETATMQSGTKRGPIILDVGAFAGHFGMTALGLWDEIVETADHWPLEALPEGRIPPRMPVVLEPAKVVALEPSSKLCGLLKSGNWDTTRTSPDGDWTVAALDPGRFDVICAAALATAGESLLHCPGGSASSVGYASAHADPSQCKPPESVRVVTIDGLAIERGINHVGILKIDAEGNDFEVIRGAKGLLQAHRIRFILFEAAELLGQSAESTYREQLALALDFLRAVGGYECFLMAPEALLPLSPPWLSNIYTDNQHTFNALCAQRDDPGLAAVIRLYSVSPRAMQFALAGLPQPHASAAVGASNPECWACAEASLSDDAARKAALAAEQYARLVYGKAMERGWQLPHFRFMLARLLQAAGDAVGALELYSKAEGSTWAAAFEATREAHRLRDNRTWSFIKRAAILASNASSASSSSKRQQAAEYALQLGWLHQRPGSGSAFGLLHACSAKAWFRRSARAGMAMGAFYAGLSAHYGHCSGVMDAKGLREAAQWYRRALRLANPGDPTSLIRLAMNALVGASSGVE